MFKVFSRFLAVILLAFSSLSNAAIKELPYQSPPLNSDDKIDVIEFFWYGCGVCKQLNPLIDEWEKTLPNDVNLVRIPAFFGDYWDIHGQIYLTLVAMDAPHEIHAKIFENPSIASDKKTITKFLTENNIDAAQFFKIHDSAGIKMQINKYRKLVRSYRLTSVPSFVVSKYRVASEGASSPKDLFNEIEQLISAERAIKQNALIKKYDDIEQKISAESALKQKQAPQN